MAILPRYIGPFDIIVSVGDWAYELALPSSMENVHNVFHVNLVRNYVPNSQNILDLDDNILVNLEQFEMELE